MSGELTDGAIARVEQDGRVLSGGTDASKLTETMERHAPPEPDAGGTTVKEQAVETGSPAPAAPDKPTRGQARFSELAKARDAAQARADAAEARAKELEARVSAPPAAREPEPKATPAPAPVAKPAAKFPDFDTWFAKPENADLTWDDYSDARTEHNYRVMREQERQEEAAKEANKRGEEMSRTYTEAEAALRVEIPDYDAVLGKLGPTDVSAVVGRAAIELGPRVAYFLASHPEVLGPLTAETLVHPDDPAFHAVVATTKRYLSTLVSAPKAAAPAKPAPPPPPAPYQPVSGNSGTTATASSELAGKGYDFDKSGYREKRAAERKAAGRR